MAGMLHVVPLNDEQPHEESTACPCSPRVEWVDPKTGDAWPNAAALVVHNAFDCREVVEQAEMLAGSSAKEPGKQWRSILLE